MASQSTEPIAPSESLVALRNLQHSLSTPTQMTNYSPNGVVTPGCKSGCRLCSGQTKRELGRVRPPGSFSNARRPRLDSAAAPPKQRRGQVKEGPAGAARGRGRGQTGTKRGKLFGIGWKKGMGQIKEGPAGVGGRKCTPPAMSVRATPCFWTFEN